jgi:O-antigen/teichoic acid export membrane protein
MSGSNSHRQILRSTSIIGGASVISIVSGLVRTKILAVLLGPTGIGLISLYTGMLATAAAVASMGIGTGCTRQIAEASSQEDERALAVVRRAMFWGALLLVSAGALVVWSLREVLAIRVLGGAEHAAIVGWLALGVALSVASASQGALMQGMRRIGDMARLSVYGALFNTLLYWLAKRRIGFQWTGTVVKLIVIIFTLCAATAVASTLYRWGTIMAVVLTLAFTYCTFWRLVYMSNLGGVGGRIAAMAQRVSLKIGLKHE